MKRQTTLFSYLVPLLALVSFAFHTACSSRREGPGVGGGSNASGPGNTPAYFKVINSREMIPYLSVAVATTPDTAFITEFNNLAPTLPQNGDSSYLGTTSRMYQNFVFRMCQKKMLEERGLSESARTVYKYAELNTDPQLYTQNDIENRFLAYIKHAARRFYPMAISNDEYQVLVDFYKAQRSVVTPDAAGAQDLAVQVCAIVGASFRSIARM